MKVIANAIYFGVVFLFIGLMVATNPDQRDFKQYMEMRIDESAQNDNFILEGLTRLMSGPTASLIESIQGDMIWCYSRSMSFQ